MNKLDILIDEFTNHDVMWKLLEKNGITRVEIEKKLVWLKKMVEQYAEQLNMSIDDVVDNFEKHRHAPWPSYYQEANYPNLETFEDILIYETLDDFKAENKQFICPTCGNIYEHPTKCEHLIKNDGICDWEVSALFRNGTHFVIIKDKSLVPIEILKPVRS